MAELGLVGDGPNSYQVIKPLTALNLKRTMKRLITALLDNMGYIYTKIFVMVFKQIWLGGTPNQTSLARTFMNKVKIQDLEKVFEPLFYYWKRKRQSKESFGNFTNRMVSTKNILRNFDLFFLGKYMEKLIFLSQISTYTLNFSFLVIRKLTRTCLY